ncbi:MAG TPA: hypothetical protein VGF94_10450 [Kofleriaceae bacterium]
MPIPQNVFESIPDQHLTRVAGGIDAGQIKSLAAQNCPQTYQRLANKPVSAITRADANACVKEWNPPGFERGYINSQLDSYFARGK